MLTVASASRMLPPSQQMTHLWPVADQVELKASRRRRVSAEEPSDACTWAERYAMLLHPVRGTVPYGPQARDYQQRLLRDTSERILIVKSRQIGISQAIAFIAAYEAVRGGTVVVVSRSGAQAMLFLDYVYGALRDAPHPPYVLENRQSLEMANGGKVITQGATKGAGRGIPASLVILDEFAWMDYAEDIYTSVMPTVANGGRVIICSTPNGRGNKFYQLYAGGGPLWSRYELPWTVHPEWASDPTWEAVKTDEIGREAFAQEHACDFLISGAAVFDQADIEALFCLPALVLPTTGRRYLSSWDLGRKQDATVGFTLDITQRPARIVAYQRMVHASYPDQQHAIEQRHRQYRGRSVVESNGVGDPVIQNLTVQVNEFTTTARTKKDAIDALQLLLQQHAIQAPPIEQLKRELGLYQRDDQKLVQDCVLALAIGAYTYLQEREFSPAVAGQRTGTAGYVVR